MQPSNTNCFLISPRYFSKMGLSFLSMWGGKYRTAEVWFPDLYACFSVPWGKALPWCSADNKNTLLLSGVYCYRGPAHTGRTQHEGFVVEPRVFNLCFISGSQPASLCSTPSWAPFTSVVLPELRHGMDVFAHLPFSWKKKRPLTTNMTIHFNVYF